MQKLLFDWRLYVVLVLGGLGLLFHEQILEYYEDLTAKEYVAEEEPVREAPGESGRSTRSREAARSSDLSAGAGAKGGGRASGQASGGKTRNMVKGAGDRNDLP